MIKARKILVSKNFPDLSEVSATMVADTHFYEIGCVNWKNFQYKPQVKFAIAHNDNEIFVKYLVNETNIRAIYTKNNDSVCKDSCCEFFVSPNCNDCFYNFETNCIGTLLLGYRKLGEKSVHANDEIMNKVRRLSTLGNQPFETKYGDFSWELIVAIPIEAFFKHKLDSLQGKTFTANFYKCGDDLPEPHYLSWKPVKTEKPSFHQPAFFGRINFV
ncbi:MAG: hypothetical protein LBC68_03005 [Prevotellaceae bacterium]|jgi:hypothetical protein|nr:hypothetical protein [Prevotellaceae bacterium]